ncbi:uncharacterized protein LOC142058276 [Phalacrocorax aristotelis]|uniref:uncharacterized protein LOC142058276 n=1 Tax=Phalacrocorax aristotelis TaxID=126867 RepID=UPI003F4B807C
MVLRGSHLNAAIPFSPFRPQEVTPGNQALSGAVAFERSPKGRPPACSQQPFQDALGSGGGAAGAAGGGPSQLQPIGAGRAPEAGGTGSTWSGSMAAVGSCRAKAPRGVAGRRRPRAAVLGAERRSRAAAVRPVDEEVSSDSEPESPSLGRRRRREAAVEEEVEETPQEKKLRLAKLYLEELRQHEEERAAAEEEEETHPADLIGDRLKEDVLEQKGRLQRLVAKDVQPPDPASIRVLRGHQLPVTCLVISPDDRFIFSASKDGSCIKWEVESGRRPCVVPGGKKGTEERHMAHASHVLCMAISSDGKYLATGDRNKLIMVWDTATCKCLHIFTGHRDAVSGLSFRKGTHQLYSASHDRCVKVWNVAENADMETLFGQQDVITGLDSLSRECCVTAGGRDGTVRLWKIPEESQLVFYGHQ